MGLLSSLLTKQGVVKGDAGTNPPKAPLKPVDAQIIDISFNLNKGSLVKHLPTDIIFTVTKRTLDKQTKAKWLWDGDRSFLYDECISVSVWQDSDYQDLADSLALIADRAFMSDSEAKSCLECFQKSYTSENLNTAFKLLPTDRQSIIKALMKLIKAEQAEKSKLEASAIRAGDRVVIIGALFNEFVRLLRVAVPVDHKWRGMEQAKIEAYWLKDWDWMGIYQVRSVDGDLVALANGRKLPVNCLQKYVQ